MKKVIITGANGFIGSRLIEKFVNIGYKVIAIDISFDNQKFDDNILVNKYEIDLNNFEDFSCIDFTGAELFYHLAWKGVNGKDKSNPFIQLENIQITLKCAELSKQIGIKKFLCAGTIAENSIKSLNNLDEVSGGMMYGTAKYSTRLILETYCKSIGLNFVWMQFANIYGSKNTTGNLISYILSELNNNKYAIFGPADQPYDFIYIDDLIEAAYRLGIIETSKGFYFIGSGSPRLLKEYLLYIGDILEKKDHIVIGERANDGIQYSFDMFDTKRIVEEIGDYITDCFENHIISIIK